MRYLPFAVVAIAMIYTLVDCVRSDPAQVRALPRGLWFLVILLLPVLGIVLWFLFGRPQAARPATAPAARPTAPDDDPRFLHDLDERRWRERAAERRAHPPSVPPASRSADRPTDEPDAPRTESARTDETRTGDGDTSRGGRTPRDATQDQTGPDGATGI